MSLSHNFIVDAVNYTFASYKNQNTMHKEISSQVWYFVLPAAQKKKREFLNWDMCVDKLT